MALDRALPGQSGLHRALLRPSESVPPDSQIERQLPTGTMAPPMPEQSRATEIEGLTWRPRQPDRRAGFRAPSPHAGELGGPRFPAPSKVRMVRRQATLA